MRKNIREFIDKNKNKFLDFLTFVSEEKYVPEAFINVDMNKDILKTCSKSEMIVNKDFYSFLKKSKELSIDDDFLESILETFIKEKTYFNINSINHIIDKHFRGNTNGIKTTIFNSDEKFDTLIKDNLLNIENSTYFTRYENERLTVYSDCGRKINRKDNSKHVKYVISLINGCIVTMYPVNEEEVKEAKRLQRLTEKEYEKMYMLTNVDSNYDLTLKGEEILNNNYFEIDPNDYTYTEDETQIFLNEVDLNNNELDVDQNYFADKDSDIDLTA